MIVKLCTVCSLWSKHFIEDAMTLLPISSMANRKKLRGAMLSLIGIWLFTFVGEANQMQHSHLMYNSENENIKEGYSWVLRDLVYS